MKKRFLIPAVCVGGLFGLAAFGTILDKINIANCNNGNFAACSEVMESTQDQITNKTWIAGQAAIAKAAEEKAAKKKAELQKVRAEFAAQQKARVEKARLAEAKFKAEGWWEQKPGIFIRWCGGQNAYCPGKESYQDYSWRAMVWCKERACGDIYAKLNIIQNGTVVGWTNETAYGGYGQKVVLTFGSYTRGNGRLVEFIARG